MQNHNPIGWFEIYVQDMQRAQKFYEAVLQVELTKLGDGDPEMLAFPGNPHNPGSTGALAKMEGVKSGCNSIIIYFICDDCAVEASRVEAAGGSIHHEKMSIGEYGFISLAYDTEGNLFGLHSMN